MGAQYCSSWVRAQVFVSTTCSATSMTFTTHSCIEGGSSYPPPQTGYRKGPCGSKVVQGLFRYLLVPKKDPIKDFHPILDLRLLDTFVRREKFRMLALHQIFPLLHQGAWMCAIDLQDAYFHIPVASKHRKFLRFMVGGSNYQYTVLPFSLKSAPRTFSKCMAVVAAYLRKQRIFVYLYHDDWLVKSSSATLLEHHLAYCLLLLCQLGLHVNLPKSTLLPHQTMHYLGATLDIAYARVFSSAERLSSICTKVLSLTGRDHTSARQVASLLGSMAFCVHIVPQARLHMRPLQQLWDAPVRLTPAVKDSLKWWMSGCNLLVGMTFQEPPPVLTIITNPSLLGWGAHLCALKIQGPWSLEEQS